MASGYWPKYLHRKIIIPSLLFSKSLPVVYPRAVPSARSGDARTAGNQLPALPGLVGGAGLLGAVRSPGHRFPGPRSSFGRGCLHGCLNNGNICLHIKRRALRNLMFKAGIGFMDITLPPPHSPLRKRGVSLKLKQGFIPVGEGDGRNL